MKKKSLFKINMESIFKTFEELSTKELYKLLQLRSEIFVVEQNCVYQDIDDADFNAVHQMLYREDQLIAYARILKPGSYFEQLSIGRILTAFKLRRTGLGHQLMQEAIDYCQKHFPDQPIKISAQQYLINFYEQHRFTKQGQGYLEDGIPHIAMIRE